MKIIDRQCKSGLALPALPAAFSEVPSDSNKDLMLRRFSLTSTISLTDVTGSQCPDASEDDLLLSESPQRPPPKSGTKCPTISVSSAVPLSGPTPSGATVSLCD
jgi:hypothetical protein